MSRSPKRTAQPIALAMAATLALAVIGVVIVAWRTHAFDRFQSPPPTSHASTAVSAAMLDSTLSRFLGQPVLQPAKWRRQPGTTSRYEAVISNLGIFVVDTVQRQVVVAVFETPGSGASNSSISEQAAERVALAFTQRLQIPLTGLVQRQPRLLDHGMFRSYLFLWQARQGETWLPTVVEIEVVDSGAVLGFTHRSNPVRIDTRAKVTANEAATAALNALRLRSDMPTTTELIVQVRPDGSQLLAWHVTVIVGGPTPARWDIAVDAHSGHVVGGV